MWGSDMLGQGKISGVSQAGEKHKKDFSFWIPPKQFHFKQKTTPTRGIHDKKACNVDRVACVSLVLWDADNTYKHNSCMSWNSLQTTKYKP